jgi:phage tail protein X
LYQRATVDYWINAMDGQPFFYVNQPVDHGLVAAMREDLAPWLEANVAVSPEHRQRMDADPRVPRFTMIFDREGYSPELFEQLWERRIAVINYHRYPKEDWPAEEFHEETVELVRGVGMQLKLAERGSLLGRQKLPVREVRRLAEGGRQISMVSTHPGGEGRRLAALLFARWSQENYFRYMRQHFGLDVLVEHGTEAMPDTAFTVNPAWRELQAKVRQKQAQWRRLKAMLGAATLDREISESAVTEYQFQQGQLQEQSEHLQRELEALKEQRKAAPHHVLVKELPEEYGFTRLRSERKHFLDTIKMICYRAETSMVSIVREKLTRADDGRALLRQIFTTEVDLIPDLPQQTLTVRLHHLTQRAHDDVIRHLCDELNATETQFPGTGLKLIYKLGSS